MNFYRNRKPPQSVQSAGEVFASALKALGVERGIRAEKKGADSGDLYIYDNIGVCWWSGEGVDEKVVLSRLAELEGVKRLNIYINSPGGDVFAGKTIYNQLFRFPAEKTVHIDGIAASAASVVAMAGDKIITETGGTWLIHRVSSGAWGFSEDLRKVADDIDTETIAIRGIYEKRTGKSSAELDAWMLEDKIMDAATAKVRGFTDEISEVEQKRADDVAAAAARNPTPRNRTPAELVATARAVRAEISKRFSGASPAKQPGQPGAVNVTTSKECKK